MSHLRSTGGDPIPTTCVEAEPFALRVLDDSMAPEFEPGCVIIVDPTGVAAHGAFVLAAHGGGYLLRRLAIVEGRCYLEALNERYETVAPAEGIDAVKGVVVQRAGTRRRDHKRY